MGNQVATASQDAIPSLPRRLEWLAGTVGTVRHPGQPERHNLPNGIAVSPQERTQAASLLSILTSWLSPDAPFRGRPAVDAKAALLTKVIRGLGGRSDVSDVEADAKMAMYADAVMDLPAWAIDAAVRRWARGRCPDEVERRPNFSFPPAPATLRALANLSLDGLRGDARRLQNLLAALPVDRAMDPSPLPPSGSLPALRRM